MWGKKKKGKDKISKEARGKRYQPKSLLEEKRGHFIKIKMSIQKEDVIIANIHTSNKRDPPNTWCKTHQN